MTHSFPTRRSSDPSLGVDISQNCGVTGFLIAGGKVRGCQTCLGTIGTGNVGMAVAGHSTALAAKARVRLPISSYALQAFVRSEERSVGKERVSRCRSRWSQDR